MITEISSLWNSIIFITIYHKKNYEIYTLFETNQHNIMNCNDSLSLSLSASLRYHRSTIVCMYVYCMHITGLHCTLHMSTWKPVPFRYSTVRYRYRTLKILSVDKQIFWILFFYYRYVRKKSTTVCLVFLEITTSTICYSE